MQEKYPGELCDFLNGWTQDPFNTRAALTEYLEILLAQPDISLKFKGRPGISYSVRAANAAQKARNFFALLDVVDDEPEQRWLSVCFYADMIQDPRGLGDIVPGGLDGGDAICFNLDEDDPQMRNYIADRLREAAANSAS